MILKNKINYIYRLHSSTSEEIKYIGTTVSIKMRQSSHRTEKSNPFKYEWVKSVLSSGAKIKCKILERCSGDIAEEREKYWISVYKDSILNITSGGQMFDGLPKEYKELRNKNSAMANRSPKENGFLNRVKKRWDTDRERQMAGIEKGKPKNSAKIKELWKDPTYRAKMMVANASPQKLEIIRRKILRSDGVLFPSIKAAAASVNRHGTTISHALKGRASPLAFTGNTRKAKKT